MDLETVIIKENLNSPKSLCEVCLESESQDGNEVIKCKVCYMAVHVFCYGEPLRSKREDEGNFASLTWTCERCLHVEKEQILYNEIICRYCKKSRGAIKYVQIRKLGNNFDDDWVHIFCVNWIPEIYFENEDQKQLVDEIWDHRRLTTRRKTTEKRKCGVCKSSQGYALNCENRTKEQKCNAIFHPTCAKETGCIFSSQIMRICLFDEKQKYEYVRVYCLNHLREYLHRNKSSLFKKAEAESTEECVAELKGFIEKMIPDTLALSAVKPPPRRIRVASQQPKTKPVKKVLKKLSSNASTVSAKKNSYSNQLQKLQKMVSSPIPVIYYNNESEESPIESEEKSIAMSDDRGKNYKYNLIQLPCQELVKRDFDVYHPFGDPESESSSFSSDSSSSSRLFSIKKKRKLNMDIESIDENQAPIEMSLYPDPVAKQFTDMEQENLLVEETLLLDCTDALVINQHVREEIARPSDITPEPLENLELTPTPQVPIANQQEQSYQSKIFDYKDLNSAFGPNTMIRIQSVFPQPSTFIEEPKNYRGKELIVLDQPFNTNIFDAKVKVVKASQFVEPQDKQYYKQYFDFIQYKYLSMGLRKETMETACKNEASFMDTQTPHRGPNSSYNKMSPIFIEQETSSVAGKSSCSTSDKGPSLDSSSPVNKSKPDSHKISECTQPSFLRFNEKYLLDDLEDIWKL